MAEICLNEHWCLLEVFAHMLYEPTSKHAIQTIEFLTELLTKTIGSTSGSALEVVKKS